MSATNEFDVIIIGAGPIGLACGIEAVRAGLSHLILEKGCIVNSIFHFPTNMTFFSTSDRLEIGAVPFVSHGERPTRREALEYYRRVVQSWNLAVRTYERVDAVTPDGARYRVASEKGTTTARAVIVATGFYDTPNPLGVPGEELAKVRHYYDEPHPYVYRDVAVVGGANSAVQVALETFRHGSRVTLVVKKAALDDSVKYWLRPDIENRIREGSITALFNSTIRRIEPDRILVDTPDGRRTLPNDFVFAMTGYRPDFDFLQRIGLAFPAVAKGTPPFDPDSFETALPNLYLAGVVCGGMDTSQWFIENARDHAPRIVQRILARSGA